VSRDIGRFPVSALTALAAHSDSNPRVSVYVPSTAGKVIVCPTAFVNGGIYIEQPPVTLLPWDAPQKALGRSVWEALLRFRSIPEPLDLRLYKKTDWLAYRTSGAKSVRAFEERFVRVSVEALPGVLKVKADVPVKAAGGLFVGHQISNACEFEALTELIQLVCRCSLQIARGEYS
jgi:hypothetical protein